MQHLTSFDANTLQAALESLIPTGIFDAVTYQYGVITCAKDGKTIIALEQSGNTWRVKPYINQSTAASGAHIVDGKILANGYLCAQGLYLMTASESGAVYHSIITKGSNGKCVSLVGIESSSIQLTNPAPYYVTSYGDDTSLNLYSSGYHVPGIAISSGAADRTQLLKIPICGQMGSTDYVDKCQAILLRQYTDPGVIEIDGTKYFCINRFAIVDE